MCFHHFSNAQILTLLQKLRGFKISELSSLLRQLDSVTVSVEPARWFRIAAIVRFKPGQNS